MVRVNVRVMVRVRVRVSVKIKNQIASIGIASIGIVTRNPKH